MSVSAAPTQSELPLPDKKRVYDFWSVASCGENLYLPSNERDAYEAHSAARYALEGKEIEELAQFPLSHGKKVLEIGVGLGADHQRFAESGAVLHGIDLTDRAIAHTDRRLKSLGLHSHLEVGDAENLAFDAGMFDIVYSWGVLHHSPNTEQAIDEVWRVLKPGGEAKVMIYHKWSMVGLMLWCRYALMRLRPWMSMNKIYAEYLESPGTKAYSIGEARAMFKKFSDVKIDITLGHADLLNSAVGQRHEGSLLRIARRVWPRWLIRNLLPSAGLTMTIRAVR